MNSNELGKLSSSSGKLYVYTMQCLGKVHLAFCSLRKPYKALRIGFSVRIQRSL